eukprot:547464-Lingulodinium_polyedra.AAC.1
MNNKPTSSSARGRSVAGSRGSPGPPRLPAAGARRAPQPGEVRGQDRRDVRHRHAHQRRDG